jgi:hypothetical protein
MKRTLLTSVLSAVAIGCTACASLDGGGSGFEPASDTASPAAMYSSSPSAAHEAEWQFTLYPANDDDGNPMPPLPAELQG